MRCRKFRLSHTSPVEPPMAALAALVSVALAPCGPHIAVDFSIVAHSIVTNSRDRYIVSGNSNMPQRDIGNYLRL